MLDQAPPSVRTPRVVERSQREVRRYVRKSRGFDRGRVFRAGDAVESVVLDVFTISVAELFEDD